VKKGGVLFLVTMTLALMWACEPPAADSPKVSKKMQNQQGIKYLEGAGVKKDEKQALEWFKKSATELKYEVKRKDSGRSIGVDYGIPFELLEVRNPGLDLERLRPGQKMLIPGHPGAQFNLAAMYEGKDRSTIDKDIEKVAKWYKKSAETGFTQAEFTWGWLHQGGEKQKNLLGDRKGKGVPKENPEEAVKWYKRAATKGHEAALYNLGTLYAAGDDPVKRDLVTAWKWFTLAKRRHGETARTDLERKANQEIRDKKTNSDTWIKAARLILQRAGTDTNGNELTLRIRLEKMPNGLNDTRVEYLRLRSDTLVNQEVNSDPSFADLPNLALSMKKEDKAEAERQASLFEFKEDPWEKQ